MYLFNVLVLVLKRHQALLIHAWCELYSNPCGTSSYKYRELSSFINRMGEWLLFANPLVIKRYRGHHVWCCQAADLKFEMDRQNLSNRSRNMVNCQAHNAARGVYPIAVKLRVFSINHFRSIFTTMGELCKSFKCVFRLFTLSFYSWVIYLYWTSLRDWCADNPSFRVSAGYRACWWERLSFINIVCCSSRGGKMITESVLVQK